MTWLAWLVTAFRLVALGGPDTRAVFHYPMALVSPEGYCACGLELGHWRHGTAGRDLAATLGVAR